MMRTIRSAAAVAAVALIAAACGNDARTGATTVPVATTSSQPTTTSATTTSPATTTTSPATTTTGSATTTTLAATTTTAMAGLEQPAIWPAPSVTFTSPEEAAANFVTEVLGKDPVLGDFQQGDSRSGEIEVFSPGEGDAATPVSRGVLLLRQLGSQDGWFVIGAVNEHESISTPETNATVAAGPLTVQGLGLGFEATVVVYAFVAGETVELDSQVTQAGAFDVAQPFTVTLDLSRATPGQTVMLLVRGAAGLETDPGEFGAIPVVIAG